MLCHHAGALEEWLTNSEVDSWQTTGQQSISWGRLASHPGELNKLASSRHKGLCIYGRYGFWYDMGPTLSQRLQYSESLSECKVFCWCRGLSVPTGVIYNTAPCMFRIFSSLLQSPDSTILHMVPMTCFSDKFSDALLVTEDSGNVTFQLWSISWPATFVVLWCELSREAQRDGSSWELLVESHILEGEEWLEAYRWPFVHCVMDGCASHHSMQMLSYIVECSIWRVS